MPSIPPARLLHVKSTLSQTPEVQELKSAIRTLHDDSKRKLSQDYEIHGALESLFGQVQAIREGLATLSEAFIEESGKQQQRLVQVESRICSLEERHEEAQRGLETQLQRDVQDVTARLEESEQSLLSRLDTSIKHQAEAQQALHEEVLAQVDKLSVATHTKIEDLSRRTDTQASDLRHASRNSLRDLTASHAAMKEDYQQKHKTVVKHAQALTQEMSQLAAAYHQLDALRKGQHGTLKELHTQIEDQKDSHADQMQELAEQITILKQSSSQANGETISRVQKAIEELEQQVASTSESCSDSVRSLRNDVSNSVSALQEQKQQSEQAAAELRGVVQGAEATWSQRLDDLAAKVEEAASTAAQQLTGLRDEHGKSMGDLREAAAAAKATRDSDLEIIERALSAAHGNHEASDQVLHSTIKTMKELEKRCGTTIVQGDALASAVDDLEHRVAVIQKALSRPQGGASQGGGVGVLDALRAARSEGGDGHQGIL